MLFPDLQILERDLGHIAGIQTGNSVLVNVCVLHRRYHLAVDIEFG